MSETLRVTPEDVDEMYDTIRGLVRIVEAFGYMSRLGKSQQERLNSARALLARIKVKA